MNFNLRGIPKEMMVALKHKAAQQNISVNKIILQVIAESIGEKKKKTIYHDLDELSGTWSQKDYENFQINIKDFGKIDKDLW